MVPQNRERVAEEQRARLRAVAPVEVRRVADEDTERRRTARQTLLVSQHHRPDKRAIGLDHELQEAVSGVEFPRVVSALQPGEALGHPEPAVVEFYLRLREKLLVARKVRPLQSTQQDTRTA